MKYFIRELITLSYIILSPALQAADELKLLTTEVLPYISKSADGSLGGVTYNQVVCILNKMEQPFSIELEPWTRVQADVERGRADGFFPSTVSDKRSKFAAASDSLMNTNIFLYYLEDAPLKPDSPEFKEKAKIAALHGTLIHQDLVDAGYVMGPDAHSFGALFDFLDRGRADAILLPEDIASTILKTRETLKKYKRHIYSYRFSVAYISNAYLENHPDFLQRFNKEIGGCKPGYSSK